VEIVADKVQFLDARGSQGGSGSPGDDEGAHDEDGSLEATEGVDERELVGVGSGGMTDDLVF
jgi:hypothetical protein